MIQYRHRNLAKEERPATFAYDLPPVEAFTDMVLSGDPHIKFHFGLSFVHPKDAYVKSIGREKALIDLQKDGMKDFLLTGILFDKGRSIYYLNTFQRGVTLTVAVTIDGEEGWSRVEWIDFAY